MSVTIIINPISGGVRPESVRQRVDVARSSVEAAGDVADVFVTERAGHARELAAAASAGGARLVMAWGGDGTVNEVASALAFGPVPLGIVPSGSGNGLARELGVHRRPDQAIADAMRAPARIVDVGELGGRLFFNLAGIGFDAHVAAIFNAAGAGRRGLWTYARIAARELLRYQPRAYRITSAGATASHRAFLISLANSPQFGNGACIAPGARIDDGELDLVVFEERSRWATMAAAPRLFLGGVESVRGMSRRPVVDVTVDSDQPMVFHVDGDAVQGGTRLEGRVHPGALRICAAGG